MFAFCMEFILRQERGWKYVYFIRKSEITEGGGLWQITVISKNKKKR